MALLMVSSMLLKSSTTDESKHLNYGKSIINLDPTRAGMLDDSKMPFSVFNAVSSGLANMILVNNFTKRVLEIANVKLTDDINKHIILLAGRLTTILFSVLLGICVFKWSRDLYGSTPGLFSLILYVFSPNIIAHSRLITTDLYATLMVTASTFFFWKYIKFGGWNRAVICAFVLGLSQLAKYTCIYLYPLFLLVILVKYRKILVKAVFEKNKAVLTKYVLVFSKYVSMFLIVNILVINVGFVFHKTLTPLSKYEFKSDLFKGIQTMPVVGNIPIPVPYPYIQGLDMVRYHERTGESFGNIYLKGEVRETVGKDFEGFKSYFSYAFLFKEPIAIQLFIILSILVFFINWSKYKYKFLENELFLVVPIIFFAIYFSLFFKAQIGIRYLLIIFPFLYIFCGNLFISWKTYNWKIKRFLAFLIIYLVVSVLSYHPHYLSYFNEFVVDRKKAYKILADSNVDWRQNGFYFDKYLEKHPDIYVNPESSVSGRIIVNVNNLVGVTCSPVKYEWLRECCEPVDHVGYSFLIYDTSNSPE
jgi:4-amino-4-deoxy-L-arabinose transferase-like glycosyltransferase